MDIPDEFSHISQDYREEYIICYFRESTNESKENFLKTCSKPDGEPIDLSYPIDLIQFNEETQWCISLANQFLGLDTDAYATESLLSHLFGLSTCPAELEFPGQSCQSCCLTFDELLAENIRSQLVNFHGTRMFRFESFLLRMFITYNEEDLQVPELEITADMATDL